MLKNYFYLAIAIFLTSCGGGGGGENTSPPDNNDTTEITSPGSTSGTLTLSGDDTSLVGTQLDTGFVGASLAAGSQPDYIVIVDKLSKVTFTEPNVLTPELNDPNNAFVAVITDASESSGFKVISMSIVVNGIKYDYACTSPVSTFIECGLDSITLDIPNKTVSFNNVLVTNTNTSTVLTLNGTLNWQ